MANTNDLSPNAAIPIPKLLTTPSGAVVSYRQLGASPGLPGLIIVHGGLEDWSCHVELARELAGSFTVYLPDRRGRGLSSAYESRATGRDDLLATSQADDLAALARHTGARLAGGVSAGAMVLLQLLASSAHRGLLDRVVVYEPPLFAGDTAGLAQFDTSVPRCEDELARGDVAGAAITSFRLMHLGPPFAFWAPYWVSRPLMSGIMMLEERWRRRSAETEREAREAARTVGAASRDGSGPDLEGATSEDTLKDEPLASMSNLVRTLPHEFRMVWEMSSRPMDSFAAAIRDSGVRILILSGTASTPQLIRATETVASLLPGSPFLRLPGLDHLGAGNRWTGGNPELVGQVMSEFFTDTGRFCVATDS